MDWLLKDHFAFNRLKRLILALAILILQCHRGLLVAAGDTLSLGSSLREKQTIISKNGTFELGFFCPNGTTNWYVGIWYAHISVRTIVWVANRETPVKNMPGLLTLSTSGCLTVSDLQGKVVWSSNNTQQAKASRASILDTGNFVLLGVQNISEIVWESFANPTDHFLPTMKFWKGLKLNAWKSSVDPAPGPFFLQMNPSPGKKDFLLQYKNGVSYYSSGDWTGKYYSTMPQAVSDTSFEQELVEFSPTRLYYTYDLTPKVRSKTMVREILRSNGELTVYYLINNKWSLVYYSPVSDCAIYGLCGAYGACFMQQNVQSCSCMEGFHPRDATAWSSQEWWSSGCVRRSPLQCSTINGSGNDTTDGFLEISNYSLSDKEAVQYTQESTLQGCKTACLNNCSCTAFVFTNSNCRLWLGDLLGMQATSSGRQTFFIRLAASDVPRSSDNAGRKSRVVAFSISIPLGVAVLGTLFAVFVQQRRQRLLKKYMEEGMPSSLRRFSYKQIKIATNNFNHMLGTGVFSSVFKGTLPDNTLVAVKDLEDCPQAEKQFRAEISAIGNKQHMNLIRLRGFCAEGSRRILVYEYMQNGSLDSFLSNKSHRLDNVLDWQTRFKIALGTARGLVYLHEECRDRIIHCDIKPENILLDADFSPKVADFGLAKLFGRDFSRVVTTIRGTRGYLAPEWMTGLPITVKVDVYSFGMTLLEIISGRRNVDLKWVSSQILKGNTISLVDERIADKADVEEVRRAAVVSILCIQEDENGRPSMAQVVKMLQGKLEASVEQIETSLQVLMNEQNIG